LSLGVERRKEKKRQKSEQGVVVEEIRRRRWGAGEMGLVHCDLCKGGSRISVALELY
jgi:hypothetical protein